MITPSAKIVIEATIKKLKDFFDNAEIVTRAQLIEYAETTGEKIPSRFWEATKISRGVHSLDVSRLSLVSTKEETIEDATDESIASEMICRFDKSLMVPSGNPNYVEWGNFNRLVTLMKNSKFFTVYLSGPSGAGKNELVENACAKLQKPMVRVSITRETKEEHLIGSKTLINGNIVYEMGPVAWAAENGACLVLDEMSTGEPSELMCLQNVMEGKPFFIKAANRVIVPAPGFFVIATDNTKGRGDVSGRYIGTSIQNDAFLERFMVTMIQDYASEKIELDILTRAFKGIRNSSELNESDSKIVSMVNKWVQVIRKSFKDEAIEELIATRRSVFVLNTYAAIGNIDEAIELCTSRFDDVTKEAFVTLWEKMKKEEVAA